MPPLHIICESAPGTVRGDGPIASASRFARTVQLDKSGDVRFSMPAVDPRTLLIANPDIHRYVRAQTRRGHTPRAEIGYGVVNSLSINSESRTLEASGPDVLDELTRTTVDTLFLHGAGEDDPMPAADVLPAIMAYALPGWTAIGTPSKDLDPYQFGDETVLAALGKIKEILGDHWRLSETVDRQIEWLPTTVDGFVPVASGIRAIDYGETTALEQNPDVCLIVDGLREVKDSTERCTRLKPRGSGNAGATLYLNGTTRVAPTGFTLHIDTDPEKSYIAYDDAEPTAADVIEHTERFSDIAPINETGAASIAAANQLFDAALVFLRRHIRAQHAYDLRVAKLHRRLRVGDSIHVQCRHKTDGFGWIWVNRHLMVLSKTETYEALGGEPVVDLEVTDATNDRYPMSDRNLLATEVIRLRDTASHVQPVQRSMGAASVTDGVTLSTTQTITGAKTISNSTSPPFAVERLTTSTNARAFAGRLRAKSSNDMVDGFGPSLALAIEDTAGVSNDIAQIAAVRTGADTSGAIAFITYLLGISAERARLDKDGNFGIGTTAPATKLHVDLVDTLSAATTNAETVARRSTGTPTAGYGVGRRWALRSSTTDNQDALLEEVLWATATHASRKARYVMSVFDTAAREAFRVEASGSAAMIGLYGVAAVPRAAALTAANNGTINSGDATTDTIIANMRTRIAELETAIKNIGITL